MLHHSHPYPVYKPSGLPWLGDVPTHWEMRRLRTVADMRVSNVDKYARDGEIPVRLCNYVDVYKNDRIRQGMAFMKATATHAEVERFRLERDDVLITKDSETWNDIGVPALVAGTDDDLVCGYHLALLRPFKEILGPYLARNLQTTGIAYQFHVRANGVTRFGLTHSSIQFVRIPLPPLAEQRAIVRYLDHADRRIGRYVAAKRKLIALMEEEKQAVVSRAVTRGLDPNVRLKSSGVEWLGDVPEHWEVRRLRHLVEGKLIYGANAAAEYNNPDWPRYLRITDFDPGGRLRSDSFRSLPPDIAKDYLVQPGDLLLARSGATVGKAFLVPPTARGMCHAGYLIRARPQRSLIDSRYLFTFTQSAAFAQWKNSTFIIATIQNISAERYADLSLPVPALLEQSQILGFLDKATAEVEAAIARARRQIELLQEYRTKLIADVVTGKLDVREAAAQLPDEADDQDQMEESGPLTDGIDEDTYDAEESAEELVMESEVTA